MKKATTKPGAAVGKTVTRIESAAREVGRLCDEITARAADRANMFSECFSLNKIVGFNEACAQFLTAIAESESNADIVAARETLERMKSRVMQANNTIAARLGDNHDLLDGVICCEKTFFRLLVEGDPTLCIIARFAAAHLAFVRIVLNAAMNSIRKQLEAVERNGEVKVQSFSLKALQQLIGAIRGRPADRAEALDFMRSLYMTGGPEFNSCRKVVNYVRTCKNVHAPYFTQCARIRKLVKALAKKEPDGEERVWRSFAQELKPAHVRARMPKS